MKNLIVAFSAALIGLPVYGQCLSEPSLRELDAAFEHALEKNDFSFFEQKLAPDFVWVHNHAGMIQRSRLEVIEFLKRVSGNGSAPQVRTQRDVRVILSASTGVVYGFTDVTRGGQELTFHFMRTYAEIGGKCVLMANQTMAIPRD